MSQVIFLWWYNT